MARQARRLAQPWISLWRSATGCSWMSPTWRHPLGGADMGAYASTSMAYGVAIDIEASVLEWWDLPEQGEVIGMGVGPYGGFKNQYLIISSTLKSLDPGDVK